MYKSQAGQAEADAKRDAGQAGDDDVVDADFEEVKDDESFLRMMGGNHLVILHANNEHSLLAHLKRNSLKVKPGQKVELAATQTCRICTFRSWTDQIY